MSQKSGAEIGWVHYVAWFYHGILRVVVRIDLVFYQPPDALQKAAVCLIIVNAIVLYTFGKSAHWLPI